MTSAELSHVDLERGVHRRPAVGSWGTEGSFYFTDAEEGSTCFSVCVSDAEGGGGPESRRSSAASECSVEVVEIKVHLGKEERDCRICHLSLESSSNESGVPIELGCSCKDDLATAHKHCAEAWFKIKGNNHVWLLQLGSRVYRKQPLCNLLTWTCEICNSVARNVAGGNEADSREPSNDSNSTMTSATELPLIVRTSETRTIWNGHRFLNFLLACMVFAFIISWLFHLNVRS